MALILLMKSPSFSSFLVKSRIQREQAKSLKPSCPFKPLESEMSVCTLYLFVNAAFF